MSLILRDLKGNAFVCGCKLTQLLRKLEALNFTEDVIGSCTNMHNSGKLNKSLKEACGKLQNILFVP